MTDCRVWFKHVLTIRHIFIYFNAIPDIVVSEMKCVTLCHGYWRNPTIHSSIGQREFIHLGHTFTSAITVNVSGGANLSDRIIDFAPVFTSFCRHAVSTVGVFGRQLLMPDSTPVPTFSFFSLFQIGCMRASMYAPFSVCVLERRRVNSTSNLGIDRSRFFFFLIKFVRGYSCQPTNMSGGPSPPNHVHITSVNHDIFFLPYLFFNCYSHHYFERMFYELTVIYIIYIYIYNIQYMRIQKPYAHTHRHETHTWPTCACTVTSRFLYLMSHPKDFG